MNRTIPLAAFAPAARLAAWIVTRSSGARRVFRRIRFPGKYWIASLVPPSPPGTEVTAGCGGLTFRIDLSDPLQLMIYLGAYEVRDLEAALRVVSPGATCVDVGSNVGFYALHFADSVGAGGRVFAVEPDPDNFRRLRGNVALNGFEARVVALNRAVTSREGTVEFRRSAGPNSGHGGILPFEEFSGERIQVQAESLDTLLDRYGVERVDLIKVDVEGAELDVLRSGERALQEGRIGAILVEFNGWWLPRQGVSPEDFFRFFADRGYALGPLNRDAAEALRSGRTSPERRVTNFLFVLEGA